MLVTGGTGYIANYIIAELLRNGFSVRTTVRDRTSAKVDILKAGCNVEGHAGAVELVETDLSSAEGWREACEGCKYVIHTASPVGDFEMNNSGFYPGMKLRNDEETNRLVQSAVDGTRFVMEAAADCGTCERVVVTSSTITISPLSKDMIFAEYPRRVDQWTEVEGTEGYQRAKILAERAAWEIAESRGLDLVTILPARTIGPSMTKINRSSVLYILDDILFQANPGLWRRLPIAENPSVDVRDVAKMHVASMLKPEAVGRRFIAYSSSPLPKDIIDPLKSAGYNHVTTVSVCSTSRNRL